MFFFLIVKAKYLLWRPKCMEKAWRQFCGAREVILSIRRHRGVIVRWARWVEIDKNLIFKVLVKSGNWATNWDFKGLWKKRKRIKNMRKRNNKLRFLKICKNAEMGQKYEETDQKYWEIPRKYFIKIKRKWI